MIDMRRTQLSFGDGLIAEEVSGLREGWMKHADVVLTDEEIVAAVYEASSACLSHRPKSFARARPVNPMSSVRW
jgi:transposase, IS5 family